VLKHKYDIEVVWEGHNLVGECPIWKSDERALYWIDVRRPSIQRLDSSGAFSTWMMPRLIGSFAFRRNGGIIAALENGFCTVNLASGAVESVVNPEPAQHDNRLNDGKCDRRGRFWCGSLNKSRTAPSGSLYRLDGDLSFRRVDTGFYVSNGIAFSPDDTLLYFADTWGEVVYVYDLDLRKGAVSNRRVYLSTRDMPGRVDGATVDEDGFYWCALVEDWAVARWDPAGRLDRLIRLPVRTPTMCAFGGDNMDVLYVTTASALLSADERLAQPLAGAVFAVHGLGVWGLAEPTFSG
jgi:L-arabinonolactonase